MNQATSVSVWYRERQFFEFFKAKPAARQAADARTVVRKINGRPRGSNQGDMNEKKCSKEESAESVERAGRLIKSLPRLAGKLKRKGPPDWVPFLLSGAIFALAPCRRQAAKRSQHCRQGRFNQHACAFASVIVTRRAYNILIGCGGDRHVDSSQAPRRYFYA